MFNFLKGVFGQENFEPLVSEINSGEKDLERLRDEELKNKSGEIKERIRQGELIDDFLPQAFALVREAAKRTLGQRHFDVQLIGGIVLHKGKIAEMLTGEGKTLAATAPAYLNALAGKGVHVVTVNDYLARRDAVWMGQIYHALGLSVGCLTHEAAYLYDPTYIQENFKSEILNSKPRSRINSLRGRQILNPKSQIQNNEKDKERDTLGAFKIVQDFLHPVSRKEAYLADITYGTNHEFGFDYLRDNLAYRPEDQVQIRVNPRSNQRESAHHYAIIDEIDSILIDEARTPLIIAAPDTESSEYYRIFARAVTQLKENEDYLVDEKLKHAAITNDGIDKIEKILRLKDIYSPESIRLVHYLEESLKARALFHRDKQYVVKEGEVIIVDEFTGRLMYGRRFSGGLHQAIEAKEGVLIKQESRTFAQITIQNYFRLYEKIAGMTGTAQTSAEEFHKVYGLDVASVPPNKPMIREDKSDFIYKNLKAKYAAITEEVREKNREGQPILIGTVSIEKNEIISGLLTRARIPYEILNAKNHEREGAIIAQAGKLGAVTVATNMAGRGVDIILGGNPQNPEEAERIKELGGLYVIGTERHEARRIDNQLRGRSGRQGDPGVSRFFLSLEDDLLRIFGGERIKSLMESFNLPDDQPIESPLVSRAVGEAQKKVEGFNFDARKHLLEYDDILNKQRAALYKRRQELLEKKTSPTILSMLDILWMNYLEDVEALREAVGMRAYGQHEPLVEFRRESHIIFNEMLDNFEKWTNSLTDTDKTQTNTDNEIDFPHESVSSPQKSVSVKVGRNDPCPCGAINPKTGQVYKYKRCGLINAPHHKKQA